MLTRRALFAALVPAPLRVAVIAHRAAHQHHPENSLPAIEAAIALGCDYVELDVRTTRDGQFVLHHDATVERGAITNLTFADLGTPLATLDQALTLLRGRCGVYVDAKQITAPEIIAALRRHDMLAHAVVYGRPALLAELTAAGHPELAMPEAVSAPILAQTLKTLRPKVIAFDRHDFHDDVIALARQANKGIFVDRLGADDNPAAWTDAVRRGATGIQTDRPAELIAALNRKPQPKRPSM